MQLPMVGEIPLYTGDDAQMAADMLRLSRPGAAEMVTGGLSSPGKMPCYAWGIPATRCKLGTILGQREGNVCHESICYAKKRNFKRKTVQKKYEARYESLFNIDWTPGLASLIHRHAKQYFRLFDSGDLQSETMLLNIIRIAKAVREVLIWMPTRETQIVLNVRKRIAELKIDWPENLIDRFSATRVDGPRPKGHKYTSSVVTGQENASCEAQLNGNKCGDCRDCWTAEHVTYPAH